MRTNTNLFCEGTSPLLKRLELKKRAGIKLTEREQQRLNETISMVQIPKNRKQNVPQKPHHQPEDEIDLDEILKEMGYGDTDDLRDEVEDDEGYNDFIGMMSKTELKQMIQDIVLDTMEEEDDLNEIIENLTRNDKII